MHAALAPTAQEEQLAAASSASLKNNNSKQQNKNKQDKKQETKGKQTPLKHSDCADSWLQPPAQRLAAASPCCY